MVWRWWHCSFWWRHGVCSAMKPYSKCIAVGKLYVVWWQVGVFIKEKKGSFSLYTQFTAVYQSWGVSNEFEFANSQMRIILGILWSCSEKQQGNNTCSVHRASLLPEADAYFCIWTHFREKTQWFFQGLWRFLLVNKCLKQESNLMHLFFFVDLVVTPLHFFIAL